jgi:hypothetical protein
MSKELEARVMAWVAAYAHERINGASIPVATATANASTGFIVAQQDEQSDKEVLALAKFAIMVDSLTRRPHALN